MNRAITYLQAAVGISLSQLRYDRLRTVLAVVGVALAVLSMTLLASVGFGVIDTGQQKFDQSGRDLWITGGPVEIAPGTIGGFQTSLTDAHSVSANISAHPDVRTAVPMSFQTLYVGTNQSNLQTTLAVGVPSGASQAVSIQSGEGFSRGDSHYADGSYNGSLSREVIVSPQIAQQRHLEAGDELNVGGTLSAAHNNRYEVIGISPTFTQFLGTPAVILPLAELQTLTNTAHNDRAALITVDVREGANVSAVEADLQATYPEYDIRTNQEQLQTVLEDRIVIIAAGATLVVLAVLTGLALTVNLLLLLVYQQRETIAALRAIGVSATALVGALALQGLILGLLGGGLGLAVTPLFAWALNAVAADIVGFTGLVQTPTVVYYLGASIAVGVAFISATAAAWRVTQIEPLQQLRR